MSGSIYDVFVSFSGKQRDFAEQLVPELRSYGFKVFFDENDMDSGLWSKILPDKVRQSRKFLPLLTKNYFDSKKSPGAAIELETARKHWKENGNEHFITPIVLGKLSDKDLKSFVFRSRFSQVDLREKFKELSADDGTISESRKDELISYIARMIVHFVDPENHDSAPPFDEWLKKQYVPVRFLWGPSPMRPNLFGREINLEEARGLLDRRSLVAVQGISGVGKSAFARALFDGLRLNTPRRFDVAYWMDLTYGSEAPFSEFAKPLIRSLTGKDASKDFDAAPDQQQAAYVYQLLAKKKTLVCLNQFEALVDTEKLEVRNLAWAEFLSLYNNGKTGSSLLLTSWKEVRDGKGRGVKFKQLLGVDADSGAHILESQQVEADFESLKKISEKLQGHPYALEVIAPRIKDIMAILEEEPQLLEGQADEVAKKVIGAIADKLDDDCRRALMSWAIFPGAFDAKLAAQAAGMEIPALLEAINRCTHRNLLQSNQGGKSYQLHYLVQCWGRAKLREDEELYNKAVDRSVKHLLQRQTKKAKDCRSADEVKPLLDAVEILTQAGRGEDATDVFFDNDLEEHLYRIGEFRRLLNIYEAFLGCEDLEENTRAAIYGNLGNAYRDLGQFEKAIEFHEKDLEIDNRTGNIAGKGRVYSNLGNAYDSLGQFYKAIEFHEKHLEICRKSSDITKKGKASCNLGIAYGKLGQFDKSICFFENALRIAKQTGDIDGEVLAYINIGCVHDNLGQFDKGIEFFEKALRIAKQAGDIVNEGRAYSGLGNEYLNLGQFKKAIEFHKKHLKICQQTGNITSEGKAYGNLGLAYYSLGQLDKAIEFHEKDLELCKRTSDIAGEGRAYGNLGIAYVNLGQLEKAIEFLEKQLEICKQTGDIAGEGRANINLANTCTNLKEKHLAQKHLDRALEIFTEILPPEHPYFEIVQNIQDDIDKLD